MYLWTQWNNNILKNFHQVSINGMLAVYNNKKEFATYYIDSNDTRQSCGIIFICTIAYSIKIILLHIC